MMFLLPLANGNPGAARFLAETQILFDTNNPIADSIVMKITDCNLRGSALWVLYSDLCGKNMEKVGKLCQDCPNDILIDACSRQDYSGVDLVKPYLE